MVINWFVIFLYLHVLGAIAAFGPSFAFPFIGAAGGREPQHANFAIRLSQTISSRLVIPIALTLAVTGFAMIGIGQINPLEHPWLLAGIILYFLALGFSLLVQAPIVARMVELTSAPPQPGQTGPPPELTKLVARSRQGGMLLTVAIVVIVFLMVVKPGG